MHFLNDLPLAEVIGAATVAAFMAVEHGWLRAHGRRGYDWRETGVSLLLSAGQSVTRALGALVIVPVYFLAYDLRAFDIPLFDPLALVALYIAQDFIYYWFHRWSHTVRWLWATHRVHHSATVFNLSAATRLGWTSLISAGWLMYLPLILIGFHPAAVIGAIGVNLAYQFFLHTEAVGKLGVLEYVFNTPSHHRVHHASNHACLDKNFGGTFIVFDRVFGTFAHAPKDRPLQYGIVGAAPSLNPLKLAFGEWIAMLGDLKSARSVKAGLVALFGRP